MGNTEGARRPRVAARCAARFTVTAALRFLLLSRVKPRIYPIKMTFKAQVRKIPRTKRMRGRLNEELSPLAQLYALLLHVDLESAQGLDLDTDRIILSQTDGKHLYQNLKRFFVKLTGPQDADERTLNAWHTTGPRIDSRCPDGVAIMEQGYLSLHPAATRARTHHQGKDQLGIYH